MFKKVISELKADKTEWLKQVKISFKKDQEKE